VKNFMLKMSTLNNKAFTLVEALFSSAIVSIVFVSVIVIFVQTVCISGRADHEYIAVNLAKARIEFARALIEANGFDSLTETKFGESSTRLNAHGVPDENGIFYRSTEVITDYDDNERLTQVEVQVGYSSMGVRTKSQTIMSMIFVDFKEEE